MDGLSRVRAAGGLVWREGPSGAVEILLVHRPRYDDWSLPKGKLRKGEHPILGAAREVFEETALRPILGARLPTVSYPVPAGESMVDKAVDYWSIAVDADDGFVPEQLGGTEVDATVWTPLDQARDRLTYGGDLAVVAAFARTGPLALPVIFVRHASADPDRGWHGRDIDRPLDPAGTARAQDLARLLSCFAPERLVSASPRRCVQTLQPLGTIGDLPIEVDGAFDESSDPAAAATRLRALAAERPAVAAGRTGRVVPRATAVCSQGSLMARALATLTNRPADSFSTAKGSGWVLFFRDGVVAAADKLQ